MLSLRTLFVYIYTDKSSNLLSLCFFHINFVFLSVLNSTLPSTTSEQLHDEERDDENRIYMPEASFTIHVEEKKQYFGMRNRKVVEKNKETNEIPSGLPTDTAHATTTTTTTSEVNKIQFIVFFFSFVSIDICIYLCNVVKL